APPTTTTHTLSLHDALPISNTLAKAAGGCKDVTLYTSTSATGQALGQVFKYNLSQMGCNVTVKLFQGFQLYVAAGTKGEPFDARSEEHTSELQSRENLVCRL